MKTPSKSSPKSKVWTADQILSSVKLSREQAAKLGIPFERKRRLIAGKKLSPSNVISERTYATASMSKRLGVKGIARETFTKKVRRGEVKYASETDRVRVLHRNEGRRVKQSIPEVTKKDLKFIVHVKEVFEGYAVPRKVGHRGLTLSEERDFAALFKRYSADQVREAFGSGLRDTGSFQMVA